MYDKIMCCSAVLICSKSTASILYSVMMHTGLAVQVSGLIVSVGSCWSLWSNCVLITLHENFRMCLKVAWCYIIKPKMLELKQAS